MNYNPLAPSATSIISVVSEGEPFYCSTKKLGIPIKTADIAFEAPVDFSCQEVGFAGVDTAFIDEFCL